MSAKDVRESPAAALTRSPEEEDLLRLELEGVASEIIQRLDAQADSSRRTPKNRSDVNYASEIGHPCAKHLVHARLDWEKRRPMEIDSIYRVEEGSRAEWHITKDLGDVGFQISQAQCSFGIPELSLRGRIDGLLPLNRTIKGMESIRAVPVEIKSINPNYWDSTRTLEDIRTHRAWWIRGYPHQLNSYLYSSPYQFGFFVLKTFGKKPRVLPMLRDPDLWDADVAKLELVNRHVAAGTYPEPVPYDDQLCGMCDWSDLCRPLRATEARTIEECDEPLLENYIMLKEWNERFEAAKKALIGNKEKPGKFYGFNAVVKDIEIITSVQRRTFYDVPDEVRAPYSRKEEIVITKIRKIE